jgi:hypothetical protein
MSNPGNGTDDPSRNIDKSKPTNPNSNKKFVAFMMIDIGIRLEFDERI